MSKIIIALDRMSMAKALELAEQAKDFVWGFKVNDLLLNYGAEIVYKLKDFGNVMADPKLFDIPNTVHNGIQTLKIAGADIITVHASANYTPTEDEKEFIAGITVLTSFNDAACWDVYAAETVEDQVKFFSQMLHKKGYKYLVCSGEDLHEITVDVKKICPGIRPSWYQKKDDQKRKMAPKEAVDAGADFLVIGRPLIMAENFVEAIEKTKEEIGE